MHDVFHVSLLKPFRDDGTRQPPPPVLMIDGTPEFKVESILTHRERWRGKKEKHSDEHKGQKLVIDYFVRWKGYGPEHNTWEPDANLTNCDEVLQEYWNRPHAAAVPLSHSESLSDGMRNLWLPTQPQMLLLFQILVLCRSAQRESAVLKLALRLLQ